jgi:glc operon protein GlcG
VQFAAALSGSAAPECGVAIFPLKISTSQRRFRARNAKCTMYVAAAKRLTHKGAKQMAAVAVGRAQDAGIAIAVAITDAGGHLVVMERMDGGRFHTVHSATTKAVCAASNRRPTSAQGAQAQPLDVAHAIGLALAAGPERWTAMEGGYPVIVEGECIGGIGVSGGDWETDARIAREAIEAIGAAWAMPAGSK